MKTLTPTLAATKKHDSNGKRNGFQNDATSNLAGRFAPFAAKMRDADAHPAVIRAFQHYYVQLLGGASGHLSADAALPIDDLPLACELAHEQESVRAALAKTVVIKLNGGLGTTMGMHGPKSLIAVKDGLTFLDIIVRQILHLREDYQTPVPLIFMNSFNTQDETEAALAGYPTLRQSLPASFCQHQAPRIWKDDLTPVDWPPDRAREWCPPGHGDIYLALQTSGLLRQMLTAGYEYAFISNADNLGATLDLDILAYFAAQQLPFLMEATRRRPSDRKGGHLAWHPEAGLILREIAQCPAEELEQFQDIERYRYFNTNNLWVNLPALEKKLQENNGLLALPLLRNEKPVEPAEPDSRRVYQLETAMGHAIALFPQAAAIEVTRERFLPVKDTNDLLALWSDLYCLRDDFRVVVNPARTVPGDLTVDLDPVHYGLFEQLQAHFRHVPSLVNCTEFRLRGDIYFDAALALEGSVGMRQSSNAALRWTSMSDGVTACEEVSPRAK